MSNELQKSNGEISSEISSSSQFITSVRQYHNNINNQTLALLEKEFTFLERLFGGKLVKAVRDQQLIQAKDEFALINRAHELKNEYTLDVIKSKCIANLTATVTIDNKNLIALVRTKLNELEEESRADFREEMYKIKQAFADVEEFKDDKNLYSTYKKFIEDSRDRTARVANKLLNKFENDVDRIIEEFGTGGRKLR